MASCSEILYDTFTLSVTQNIFVFVLIITIALLTVTINSVLAVTLWKTKQLNNSTNIYIFLLSLSDCMLGSVAMPLTAGLYLTHTSPKKCKLYVIARGFSSFNGHFSGYLILLVAFDRYMRVRVDFTEDNGCFKRLKSKCGSISLIASGFTWSVLAGGSTVIENELAIKLPSICMYVTEMCGMITAFVLYIRMYYKTLRHVKTSMVYQGTSNKKQAGEVLNQEEMKHKNGNTPKYTGELRKTILFILITVAVCYFPFVTRLYITGFVKGTVSHSVRMSFALSLATTYFNSFLNACIILYRNSRLSGYLKAQCCVNHVDPLEKMSCKTEIKTQQVRSKQGNSNKSF